VIFDKKTDHKYERDTHTFKWLKTPGDKLITKTIFISHHFLVIHVASYSNRHQWANLIVLHI